MLLAALGNVGNGKTLFIVILSYFAWLKQKVKVVSNFHLNFPFEKLDIGQFVESKYENSVVLLDEVYTYVDSRLSMSEKNRAFSYVLMQSRKKNIQMLITAQMLHSIDMRYRDLITYYVLCEKQSDGFHYIIYNNKGQTREFIISFEKAAFFFSLYDTNELIISSVQEQRAATISLATPEEKKKRVMELVDTIVETYDVPEGGYTHDHLTRYFFELGWELEKRLEPIVYSYLKERGLTASLKQPKEKTFTNRKTKVIPDETTSE